MAGVSINRIELIDSFLVFELYWKMDFKETNVCFRSTMSWQVRLQMQVILVYDNQIRVNQIKFD